MVGYIYPSPTLVIPSGSRQARRRQMVGVEVEYNDLTIQKMKATSYHVHASQAKATAGSVAYPHKESWRFFLILFSVFLFFFYSASCSSLSCFFPRHYFYHQSQQKTREGRENSLMIDGKRRKRTTNKRTSCAWCFLFKSSGKRKLAALYLSISPSVSSGLF